MIFTRDVASGQAYAQEVEPEAGEGARVDSYQIALQKQAQTTPDPSYRQTPSRRRLVTKFGSAPISSSPRTPPWRNNAVPTAAKRL